MGGGLEELAKMITSEALEPERSVLENLQELRRLAFQLMRTCLSVEGEAGRVACREAVNFLKELSDSLAKVGLAKLLSHALRSQHGDEPWVVIVRRLAARLSEVIAGLVPIVGGDRVPCIVMRDFVTAKGWVARRGDTVFLEVHQALLLEASGLVEMLKSASLQVFRDLVAARGRPADARAEAADDVLPQM